MSASVPSLLASVAAGLLLARVLDRSGLALDGVFRGTALTGDPAAFHGWLFAAALLWLAGAAFTAGPVGSAAPRLPIGPLAAVLGGLLAGVAVSVLAADPAMLALDAGALAPGALTGLAGCVAGYAAGVVGPLAATLERIRGAGPAELFESSLAWVVAAPVWVLPGAAALAALLHLIRQPVVIRPGRMEWPKAGVGLAVAALAFGWGGSRLAAGCGLAAYGLARRRGVPAPAAAWPASVIRLGGGALLGLAVALAGGDPASRTLLGTATLSLGGVTFVAAFGCGAFLMALLEWKLRGRPGGKPVLGHGV